MEISTGCYNLDGCEISIPILLTAILMAVKCLMTKIENKNSLQGDRCRVPR